MSSPRFGISTHLYHDLRLTRDHLAEIAAHGFDCVELFATRSHFDYHDGAAVRALAEWLEKTRLTLHSLHAPITASFTDGVWGESFSSANPDENGRRRAVTEAEAAIAIAQVIPFRCLVVHLGVPDGIGNGGNSREAARRSVEAIHAAAERAGTRVALEVIPNALSEPDALVAFIENDLEGLDVGICMDVGHAHMLGDVGDAIESCSGHIITTHLHDNRRKSDDHLSPGEGNIDWEATLMELQKVGYEGALMFEVANTSTTAAVLEATAQARRRFESMMHFTFEE